MASGDMEEPLCRVCKTVFTFKGPEPHLLPCLHPACKACVDSGHESITCTTCQQLFSKAEHAFPKHFVLSKDLFQSALKESPSDITCTYRNDGGRADTWCPQCDAFLCSTCLEFHKDTKGTRCHVVVSLQSYLDQENDCAKTNNVCEIHQGHPLGVFDSSCGFLVCYKCLKEDHSTCCVENIDEAYDKMKESELDRNIKNIDARLDVIAEMEQKAQDLTKKLVERSKIVRDEVISAFSDIRETLDMREEILLQETSQSFLEVENANTKRMEVLKKEKTRCEAALRFIKRTKEISDPVHALRMKKTIDERTTACIEADLKEMDGREASISLSTNDLSDLKQSIKTFTGLYSIFDEGSLEEVTPGLTTKEKQDKVLQNLIQVQKEASAFRRTLENIPRLIEQRHKKVSMCRKIPGISAIKHSCTFYSETKYLNNMPWYLLAQFRMKGDILMLGLYLCPSIKNAEVIEVGKKWVCEVKGTFEITNWFSQDFAKRRELSHAFTEASVFGWGYGNMISQKELQDPLKGFVKEDCINVSVDVEIFYTTGILNLEELVKKKCSEALENQC